MTINVDELARRLARVEDAQRPPTGAPKSNDGWEEWGLHVLAEIKRGNEERALLRDDIADMRKELAGDMIQLHGEITALNVKAGFWGALSGAVVVIGALLMNLWR